MQCATTSTDTSSDCMKNRLVQHPTNLLTVFFQPIFQLALLLVLREITEVSRRTSLGSGGKLF